MLTRSNRHPSLLRADDTQLVVVDVQESLLRAIWERERLVRNVTILLDGARVMRLPVEEFLRRFFLHALPRGFVRIRHFGFLAHRRRRALLPLCFALLPRAEAPRPAIPATPEDPRPPLWGCPRCGGPMVILERFSASGARFRAPPAGTKNP